MESMCWTLFEGKNPVTVVLEHMCPGAQYTVQGYTLKDVTWNSTDMPMPTEEEFNLELKLLVEKKQRERIWKPQRLAAYPPIEDQLDMIYWDQINGTQKWRDTITEIKKKFPKDPPF